MKLYTMDNIQDSLSLIFANSLHLYTSPPFFPYSKEKLHCLKPNKTPESLFLCA
jgi:hypothetical protein